MPSSLPVPKPFIEGPIFHLAAVLAIWCCCLSSCSSDPISRRNKFLASGEQYLKEQKLQEAVIEFRNAIQADPKSAAAHERLAQTYLALRNPDGAYRELQEGLKLAPADPSIQLALANVLVSRRDYAAAEPLLSAVLKAKPGSAHAHALLGQKYAAEEKQEPAFDEFRKAIQLDPSRTEYSEALAALLIAAHRIDDAAAVHRDAAAQNPKSLKAALNLATFHFGKKDFETARTVALRAAELDKASPAPQLLLIQIDMETRQFANAEARARQLKQAMGNDPDAYLSLSKFYLATGKREAAIQELRTLISAHPKDQEAPLALADLLIRETRPKEAELVLQPILKSEPSDPRVVVANGEILLALGRAQEASLAFEKAITLQRPPDARTLCLLGSAQKALGLRQQSRGSFQKALDLDPQLLQAKLGLAAIASDVGDHDRGSRISEEAIRDNPNSPAAYAASAKILLAKGEQKAAEARIYKALELDPTSQPALALLLRIATTPAKLRDAMSRLEALAERQPHIAGLRFLLGLGHYAKGNLADAEREVRKAIEMDPRTAEVHTLLANIYLSSGRVAEAKTALATATRNEPMNVTTYLMLEGIAEREGNWAEAKRLMERAHELDPDSPIVANQLAFLYLEHGGDPSAALAYAQLANQKLPDSPNVADTLGWAMYKAGRQTDSIPHFRRCIQAAPANATCHYHLGLALLGTGDRQGAERSLTQALRSPGFSYGPAAQAALATIAKR